MGAVSGFLATALTRSSDTAQAAELAVQLQQRALTLEMRSFDDLLHLPWLRASFGWMEQHLAISTDQLQVWALAGAQKVLQPLVAMGGALFLGAVGTLLFGLVGLLLGPVVIALALELLELLGEQAPSAAGR
jgi:hypothetical protein